MGELVGLPEWLAATLFALLFLALLFAFAWRNTLRQIRRVQSRRPNPSQDEFMALMLPHVSEAVSAFLWEATTSILQPRLTAHPDDLLTDLPIDEDEWSMDWPRDFADRCGFDEKRIPDWPEGWAATVRNYGRWLDLGLNG